MIYARYSKSIKIDKNEFINKIEKLSKEKFFLEYNLSEIVFNKKQNISLTEHSDKIFESIEINGFENTANLFSIADSSKAGGNIGWVKKIHLIDKISKEVEKLKIGEISKVIEFPNGYLIIQVNDIRMVENKFNVNKEIDKRVNSEIDRQLNELSLVFFNKVKQKIIISEL